MIESHYNLCKNCKRSTYEPTFGGDGLTRIGSKLVCSIGNKPAFHKTLFNKKKKPCNFFIEK